MEKSHAEKEKRPSLTFERATEKGAEMFLDLERSAIGSPTYSPTTDPVEALEELEKNVVYFIREGDEVVGSVMYQMKSPDHAYISGLIARPDYQGRGIGREAMVKVLEELRNIPAIDLVTHPGNSRAVQLYESLGFIVGDRLENHFSDGEPRVVMTLKRFGQGFGQG